MAKKIKALERYKRKLKALKPVRVGVPAAAATKDGTKIAVYAAAHEYGSSAKNIPERSFLRPGIKNTQPLARLLYQQQLPQYMAGEITAKALQSQLGELAIGEVVAMIDSGAHKELSKPWRKAKERILGTTDTQTLRLHNNMANSIIYEIKK